MTAATPGQADELPLSLRAEVTQTARGLRREADGIETDPYLNQHVRHADAEARRAAAARIEMAVTEDRNRPAPTVRDGIDQALSALRRMGDACTPSRAARVRAALAESERLIREAYDGSAIAAQGARPAPGASSALGLKHAVTSNRLGHALAALREIRDGDGADSGDLVERAVTALADDAAAGDD